MAGAQTYQPRKKPRGRELPAYSLAINKVISRVRVGVEHAICGVKRCRIVADTFRNLRHGFVDAVMEVAAACTTYASPPAPEQNPTSDQYKPTQ